MTDQHRAKSISNHIPVWALLAAAAAGLYATQAAALPPGPRTLPAAGVVRIEDQAPAAPATSTPDDQARAPFAELNAALAAARARLEELSKTAAAAASAGQARQELSAAKQENEQLRAQLATLQQTSQSAEARIAELTKAAEDAAAEVKRIEKELVTMRWQNAQLNTSLTRAQAARDEALAEAHKTEEALSTKVETLTRSAEQSATEIARLRTTLADAEHQLETAKSARDEVDARLGDLQTKLQGAEARSNRADEQLSALQGQVEQAEHERDQARATIADLTPEADRLRAALASAEAEVEQATRTRHALEQEVAQMRTAASSATDAARQNLLAVEAQIKELNSALVVETPVALAVKPEVNLPGSPKAIPAAVPAAETASAGPTGAAPETSPPAPAGTLARPDHAAPASTEVAAIEATPTSARDADIDRIKSAPDGETPRDGDLAQATANLPLEQRLQVQGLLIDLGARVGPQGLALTVPGQGLFATNSDEIEPTAHDTLAKVADLIDAYKGHRVRIIGYTDAVGDESYNKILSERRANLVKQFFVDNFEVDGGRLSVEGRGEDEPIASNQTPAGRQANRRVEVQILN